MFSQHRAAALLDCDRIVVFDEGKIVEEGSPTDLIQQQNGIFYAMIKAAEQSGGERWSWTKGKKKRRADGLHLIAMSI